MTNRSKLEQLQPCTEVRQDRGSHLLCAFPKLTEVNQQYVLGVAEGLKFAQNKQGESPEKRLLRESGQN